MSELLQLQKPYPLPRHRLLPLREQPVYRVAHNAAACNLTELLAVVAGGPRPLETAEALLQRFGSLDGLYQAHVNEIAALKGIGQQTAVRLKAALALSQKLLEPAAARQGVHNPEQAAGLVLPEMGLLDQEHLRVILLDTRNQLLEIAEVYRGSLNSAQVRVGELFRPAIQCNAAAVIAVHNHPSTDPNPSPDDVAVTRALVQAGKLLDIELVDHLIVARAGFVSLKSRGLGFSTT